MMSLLVLVMDRQRKNVFYQLAKGEIPSRTVYEDENVRGILDTNPARKGHILFLPKKQMQVSPQMDEDTTRSMSEALKTMSERALKAFDIGGTTMFVANGGVAGQKAPHLLLHLIPRSENDGVGLKPQPKKIPDEKYGVVKEQLLQALGQGGQAQTEEVQKSKQRKQPQREQANETSTSEEDVDFDKIEKMFR